MRQTNDGEHKDCLCYTNTNAKPNSGNSLAISEPTMLSGVALISICGEAKQKEIENMCSVVVN